MEKITSAREIMDGAEEVIVLPTLGWTVKIRAVGNLDLIFHGAKGLITTDDAFGLAGLDKDGRKKRIASLSEDEKKKLAADEYEGSKQIVMAGMIEPRAVDLDWSEIDRDFEIHISRLDPDMIWLAMRILQKSGLVKEVPEMKGFFRQPVAAASTSDGGDLRASSDRDSKAPVSGIQPKPRVLSTGKRGRSKGNGKAQARVADHQATGAIPQGHEEVR